MSGPRIFTPTTTDERRALVAWFVARMPWPMDLSRAQPLGVLHSGDTVAVALFYDYRRMPFGASMEAGIAAAPGSGWASRSVLRALFHYPFIQLGCTRLTAITAETNTAARSLIGRMGFVEEGRLRGAYNGREDALVHGMLRAECKWLLAAPREALAAA